MTDGRLTQTQIWACRISDTAPGWTTQYLVLPAPPVDGPVTQLDLPDGPPAPACATHRPSPLRVRCRGFFRPLHTTLPVVFDDGEARAAAPGMAPPAATAPARA